MRYKIKYIDFRKQPRKGNWWDGVGLSDFEERIIYIHSKLPETTDGTKRLCIEHEKAHFRHENLNNFLKSKEEESFIELEGLCRTPDKNLSIAERLIKKFLTKDGKINPKKDKKKLTKSILIFLGVKNYRKLVKKIIKGN